MQPLCEGDCVHSSVLPYVRHRVEWGYIESPARSTFISDRGRNQPKLDLNRDDFLQVVFYLLYSLFFFCPVGKHSLECVVFTE